MDKKNEYLNKESIKAKDQISENKEAEKKHLVKTRFIISLLFLIIIFAVIIWTIKVISISYNKQNVNPQSIQATQIPNGHEAFPFNTKTSRLMTIPNNCDSTSYRYFTSFSPNGRNVGFICGSAVKEGNSWYTTNQILINGNRQKVYNSESSVNFDTKYDEYAYTTKGNGRDNVIFNGVDLGSYPAESVDPLGEAGNYNPLFYNGHLAYVSSANNSITFIYDGKVVAKTGNKYSFIFNPLVSNDGNHYVFSAEKGSEENSVIVRDGKEIDKEDGFIRDLVINNDASKFAYSLESTDSARIVINGIIGKKYSRVFNITMSYDGSHLAFLAQGSGSFFWVVDGKEYFQYKEIGEVFLFSPDSRHFVFPVIDPNNSHHQALIEDGQLQGSYKIISNLVYSKDGKTLAFFATTNNINYVVVNYVNTPLVLANSSQIASNLILSPDGSKVLYKVSDGIHENAVINGKLSENYDVILSRVYFSPDGKYAGFGVQKANQLWWIAMNLTKQNIPNSLHITVTNTPTSTVAPPSPTTQIPSSYKTFTSNDLGISFSYPSVSWNITPQAEGSKIFFGNDTGQFIQVFHLLQPANNIESAIKNTVLKGYSDEDCQVVTGSPGSRGFGLNMEFATITFPGNDGGDENQPAEAFCPQGYVNKGGLFYFIMDKNHPSILLFIAESQQPLAGVGSQITTSIKVLY